VTSALLYVATVMIWGTGWIAIQFQLGPVAPEVSLAYRFQIAALVMVAYCLLARRSLRFGLHEHGWIALQGVMLFSFNFYLVYLGSQYLPSGLVSVVFSTLPLWSLFFGALLFKTSIQPRVFAGAAIGLGGVALVFSPELDHLSLADDTVKGLLYCLGGTIFASLGMLTSLRNQQNGIPVIQGNAIGMVYGGAIMTLFALVTGKPFNFSFTWGYVLSLAHLAVFATVIAFACYLSLQARIGADKAAYASVLFPVIALAISTVVENFQWTEFAAFGAVLVLWGNLLVLTRPGALIGRFRRPKAEPVPPPIKET